MIKGPTILQLSDAPNADGEPRAALLVPGVGRRPVLTLFATVSAAVAAKRELESGEGQGKRGAR